MRKKFDEEHFRSICKHDGMDAQDAVNELGRYFLGDDWYSVATSNAQVNAEIVREIEMKYKGAKVKRSKRR